LEVPRKLFVRQRVKDGQHVGLQDCVGTKRPITLNLFKYKVGFRLKPHPLFVDKRYNGDRSVAGNSGQESKIIEHLLRGRSQNPKVTKNFETVTFVSL
jgi:hypothetical protein